MDDIDWGHLLFGFDGRINRAQFWAGATLVFGLVFASVAVGFAARNIFIWGFIAIVNLMTIYIGLAVSIKRWHDRGKSGWWVLIGLVPVIGSIWALIETGFLEGDPGPNEYGPNPLATGIALAA